MNIPAKLSSTKYRVALGAAILGFFFLGILFWLFFQPKSLKERTYKIGWEIDPPEQVRGDNGEPTGFAVDLVREAARRAGVRLTWVYQKGGPDASLRSGSVDLWPLMIRTPERLRVIHVSSPYIESVRCLLVRGARTIPQMEDLSTARISYSGGKTGKAYLARQFPKAQAVVRARDGLIGSVCSGDVDATLTEVHTAVRTLLETGGCSGQPLKLIPTNDAHNQLGLGATFASAGAADAIRDQIGEMAAEGQMNPLMTKWGYLPDRNEALFLAVRDARDRDWLFTALAATFALFVLLMTWQMHRTAKETRKARRSEQNLRQSEQRFRGLLENVRASTLMMDLAGCITFCNDYFLNVTGWQREDVIGHNIKEFLPPGDRLRVSHIIETFSDRTPPYWTAQNSLLTKNGKVRWFDSNLLVLRDEQGRGSGFADISFDVTEHRTLEAQYLQAQKMEGLGRLAGGVAHDFNNLLTVINGYSDIIFQKLTEQDPLRPSVDYIRNAGARAADLTRQLLAFSRKQMSQPKPLDLNTVVANTENMWRRVLGENIQLVTMLGPEVGAVMADAGQIQQVLMNLVVNARDAMPNGGKLIIETSNIEVESPDAPDVPTGHFVVLAVSDSGVGMGDETKARLFEPFFTTKPEGAGTGLGLATVYGIVTQSRGWIRVHSEAGAGSTFSIYLPRVEAAVETIESSDEVRTSQLYSETILVVEDEEDVRRFVVEALAQCGYPVLSACSAAEALSHVQDSVKPIHLVITDFGLPGMNGFELAKRLKAIRPGIRLFFMSGYTGETTAFESILERGLPYLAKPFTAAQLAAKVRAAIDVTTPQGL
jgi:PAS domain S-box-containing protein